MKNLVAIWLVFVASAAHAGMSYHFSSTTDRSKTTLAGNVNVEGKNIRIDFEKGDDILFRDGSIVVSHDGGNTVYLIDPKRKTYSDLNIEQLFSALGDITRSGSGLFDISIRNHAVGVRPPVAGGIIENYPTKKWVIDASYDLTIKLLGETTQMKVRSLTESWTTDKLSREYLTFLQLKPLRTGVKELDDFLAAQTKNVTGFPLRQVVRSTTTTGGHTETSTTTVVISRIRVVTIHRDVFRIPSGFRKEAPKISMP